VSTQALLVRIDSIAAGGDGVGRLPDGRAVFVPRGAPGDLAELTQLRTHRRFARAALGRVVEPGAERVEPRCRHYTGDSCGGCQLQHLSPGAQLAAKRAIVGDALRRLGGLDLPDPEIEAAPQAWAYRNKLTLAVGEGGRRVGLHPFGRPDAVFDLVRCEIAAIELQQLWSAVRSLRELLPPGLTHLVLRLDAEGGRHLILRTEPGARPPEVDPLGRGLREASAPAIVWWEPAEGAARVLFGGKDAYPAVVFEQVNPAFARRIRQFAIERLGAVKGRLAWDLYAGIGDTTLALANLGARVEMVERDARAVRLAERSWRAARGLPLEGQAPLGLPVTAHVGAAEDLTPRLPHPDLVIANPPRVGMEERVASTLRERGPERIVYVSCDPATLARDVKRMGEGYRASEVRAFDLFPETAHVETVLVLERTA